MANYTNKVTQIPKLVLTLNITNNDGVVLKTVDIKEGDIVKNLVYKVNNEYKTITGKVKVINFKSKSKTYMTTDKCIHDNQSVFDLYVTPVSLIVDCSTEYNNDVVVVGIESIKDINSVEFSISEGEENKITTKVSLVQSKYYNQENTNGGQTSYIDADIEDFMIAINGDFASFKEDTFTLNGEELPKEDIKISVGNNNFVKVPAYIVEDDCFKINSYVIALVQPVDGELALVSNNGLTVNITVPDFTTMELTDIVAVHPEVVSIEKDEDGAYKVILPVDYNTNTWQHQINFHFEGDLTASTVYMTKGEFDYADGRHIVSYCSTDAEPDGSFGFYPAPNTSVVYYVTTTDRYASTVIKFYTVFAE